MWALAIQTVNRWLKRLRVSLEPVKGQLDGVIEVDIAITRKILLSKLLRLAV